jgi:RNA polymerase sigma-70 factor (ECF subfamily)
MDARRTHIASISLGVRQQSEEHPMHSHDTALATALVTAPVTTSVTTGAGTDDLDEQWADTLDRLRAFVARRVDDRELAADITQDVIVRSIASGALTSVDNPVAWLYRSARNAVIDHYRTRHPHDALDDHDRWPDPDVNEAEPNDATRELSRCLRPLLGRLNPAAREALERVDVAGETHQHAADRLGLSVSGMKSRVQRARRDLRQLLEQCCIVELDNLGAVAAYRPSTDDCGCATTPGSCS